jgi:hypothetical protein
MASTQPDANAAAMFPRAASANRPIFYDKRGNARSVAGVYAELVRRYQVAAASGAPKTITAAGIGAPKPAPQGLTPPAPAVRAASPDTMAFANTFSDPNAGVLAPPISKSDGPVFHSLFHSDGRSSAVAPLVAELWGPRAAQTDIDPLSTTTAVPASSRSSR